VSQSGGRDSGRREGLVSQAGGRDNGRREGLVSKKEANDNGRSEVSTPVRTEGLVSRADGKDNGDSAEVNSTKEDTKNGQEADGSESDSDSDDDSDGGYLHPLLMKASLSRSPKPSSAATEAAPPISEPAPPSTDANWVPLGSTHTRNINKKMSLEELLSLHNTSFTDTGAMASRGEATPAQETFNDADARAAYEHYKQQYYGR
jgi:hypothetical protein